jgi:hypothetical protein
MGEFANTIQIIKVLQETLQIGNCVGKRTLLIKHLLWHLKKRSRGGKANTVKATPEEANSIAEGLKVFTEEAKVIEEELKGVKEEAKVIVEKSKVNYL